MLLKDDGSDQTSNGVLPPQDAGGIAALPDVAVEALELADGLPLGAMPPKA